MIDLANHKKIFAHPERITEWLRGRKAPPILIGLSMTNRCQHSCPDCNGGRLRDPMAHWTYQDAVNLLDRSRAQAVIFGGGGEPLANPDTPRVIDYARSRRGISCGLITNLTTLKAEWIHSLLYHCSWIRVSLDAADANSYAKRHGKQANWEETLANIRNLVANREADKPRIGASFLVDEQNQRQIPAMKELAGNLGLDYAQFKKFDGSDHILAAETLPRMQAKTYTRCHAMNFIAEIAADGTLYPCCFHKNHGAHPLANVKDDKWEDFLHCWFSDEVRSGMENLDVAKCPPWCRNHNLNQTLQEVFMDNVPEDAEFI